MTVLDAPPCLPESDPCGTCDFCLASAAPVRSFTDLMGRTFPPLRWHVPNVLPEGFSLFVGSPKVGKSWFALDVVCAAVTGGAVLTEALTPRPTLYLALEDSDRRLQARILKLGYGESDPGAFRLGSFETRVAAGVDPLGLVGDWLETLPRELDAPPLAIVDTLGRCRGPRMNGESPYDADYRLGSGLHRLAQEVDGLSITAVHHDRKADSSDWLDSVSGTNGLAGSADTIAVLRREREADQGVILVTGRDVTEAAYALDFDAGRWTLAGHDWDEARRRAAAITASTGRGDLAKRIVDYLTAVDGATPKQIATALDVTGDAVRMALKRMRDSDAVPSDDQHRHFLPEQP